MDDVLYFVNMEDQDHLQVSFQSILILKKIICFFLLVVIAYLICHHGHTLSSAYLYLLKIRPTICPNRNYLNQLDKYSSQSEQTRCPSIYS
jgi:hypothetical protein